jgi:hypothetical protein
MLEYGEYWVKVQNLDTGKSIKQYFYNHPECKPESIHITVPG